MDYILRIFLHTINKNIGSNIKMKENKLILKWDIGVLNKMIGLVYKKSRNITLFNLRNLQELIRNSDFTLYTNKNMIIKRVQFSL